MAFGDNSFGPHLAGLFDFTLTFEQSILSLLPGGLFLLALLLRLRVLLRLQKCVASRQLLAAKMVKMFSTCYPRSCELTHVLDRQRQLHNSSAC